MNNFFRSRNKKIAISLHFSKTHTSDYSEFLPLYLASNYLIFNIQFLVNHSKCKTYYCVHIKQMLVTKRALAL